MDHGKNALANCKVDCANLNGTYHVTLVFDKNIIEETKLLNVVKKPSFPSTINAISYEAKCTECFFGFYFIVH